MRQLIVCCSFFVFIISSVPGISAKENESMMTDPRTGLVIKVVAGSNKIAALEEPDGDAAFTLDILEPYYVIEERGEYFRVSSKRAVTRSEALAGNVGWVRQDQVYMWPTREGLRLRPVTITADDDPKVSAWDEKSKIEKYMKTANPDFSADYEQSVKDSLILDRKFRPYPILESFNTPFVAGDDKRVFNVLIPATIKGAGVKVESGEIETVTRVLESVVYCVVFDATGSMQSVAENVAKEINAAVQGAGAQVFKNAKMGFVFFRDRNDDEKVRIEPPSSIESAANFLQRYAASMSGGDDPAEPILDALYLATHNYEWGGSGEQSAGARKIIIAVLNADAHPTTQGGIDDRVPVGLAPEDVASDIASENIVAITVQAGPSAGDNLKDVLRKVAELSNGGAFIEWSETMRNVIGKRIKEAAKSEAIATAAETKKVKDSAEKISDGSFVIPLDVLDGEKLNRLREAGLRFNLGDDGGILVRKAYVPENEQLLSHEIRIEKDTITNLLQLFRALTVTTLSTNEMRQTLAKEIGAIAGETYDGKVKLSELIKKKLGIQFRTGLLKLNIDELYGMTAEERSAWQNRVRKASDKLADFLEARGDDFDKLGLGLDDRRKHAIVQSIARRDHNHPWGPVSGQRISSPYPEV